jgi:cobalt-precorrin 5A hydrolase/precorrin-3B C17-methyltransferase
VLATIDAALAAGGLAPESVVRLASVDLKADEPGLAQAAAMRGWPLVFHSAEALASVEVPNPSPVVAAETGTPSVAEAAARYDGPGRPLADLVVEKTKSPTAVRPEGTASMATAAVARLRPRGRLAVVGLGPGARDLLAPRAVAELRRASAVVGLDQYVEQIRDLLRPGTEIRVSGLGAEEERARSAVDLARTGRSVALIGSGDAGIYAMASPALDYAGADDVDVVCVPGITAAGAASNVLGAPLGHDHCSISLSDLHTPWEAIERRVRAAAEGDFVVSFYNPRSRQRDWQLAKALGILAVHRPAGTPVGWVRNASRADESQGLTTLAEFDPAVVDMYTVVTVGCSQSRIVGGRFVTPRGYTWAQ